MKTNIAKPKVEAILIVRYANGDVKVDGDPRDLPEKVKLAIGEPDMQKAIERYDNSKG